MGAEIPRIKKRINAFLVGEEGKISKQSLLAMSAVLGTAAMSNIATAALVHNNNVYTDMTQYAGHGHHSSHGSHSSHSSHSSHASHSSHDNY